MNYYINQVKPVFRTIWFWSLFVPLICGLLYTMLLAFALAPVLIHPDMVKLIVVYSLTMVLSMILGISILIYLSSK